MLLLEALSHLLQLQEPSLQLGDGLGALPQLLLHPDHGHVAVDVRPEETAMRWFYLCSSGSSRSPEASASPEGGGLLLPQLQQLLLMLCLLLPQLLPEQLDAPLLLLHVAPLELHHVLPAQRIKTVSSKLKAG